MRQIVSVFGKTFTDLSNPKILVAYFAPFLVVSWFFGLIYGDNELTDAAAPLAQQEIELFSAYLTISFFWVGLWLLALTAVLSANTLARETEKGTLKILLSKPISRWQVLLGNYAAVVAYASLVGLASLLVWASLLIVMSDLSSAAIPEGIFAALPGAFAYLVFAVAVVAAVGLVLSLVTKSRLQTALSTLVVPILFFAFWVIRLFIDDTYEDFHLYLFDMNYQFGNAFVFINELVGGEFAVETETVLSVFSGVYEVPEEGPDLDQQLPESLELVGHLSPEVSVVLLSVVAVVSLAGAVYLFETMDI